MQTWINDQCDRSKWPAGAWDCEPDKVQWKDAATGLDCLANRHPRRGHWCGYVGIPPGHPLHGKHYDEVYRGDDDYPPESLTFSDECEETDAPCRGICHVAAPGEPDKLWWFGFDFAHCDDAAPYDYMREPEGYPWSPVHGTYKTLDYVKGCCAGLAKWIAATPPLNQDSISK